MPREPPDKLPAVTCLSHAWVSLSHSHGVHHDIREAHGIKLSHQPSFPHCVVQTRSSWSRLDFNFADFALGMLMLHSSRPALTMLNYWKEGMEVPRPQALSAFFVDLRCAVNKIQTALDKLGPELSLLDGKQPSLWSWTACLEINGLEWRKATVRSVEGRSADLPQDESAKVQVLTTTQEDSAAESESVANNDQSKSELVLQWRRSSFLRSLGKLAEYRKDSQIQRKMLKT